MRILLRAPLLTTSGYGVHSRQVFEWLSEIKGIQLDVECLNWGMTPWILNKDYENGLIEKIMKCSKKIEPPYDVTFQLQLPDEWDPKLGKVNVGMTALVETDRCNPKWIDACNKMDYVVVPSHFTKSVLRRSGILTTPVEVIHEWYDENIDESNDSESLFDKEYEKIDTKFNFLMIAQLNGTNPEDDRKNIYNTVKWICEEFKDNKDVGLILKTNAGKGSTIDKKNTQNILKQMMNSFDKKLFPKVYLLHGNMSKKEISKLYKRKDVKCYVSATRGEGYGLPLIDAAAAGIPVVATNWSGHLDFLKDKFIKINYTLKEIRKEKVENRIFLEGFRWADPDPQDFKEKLKNFYENSESMTAMAKLLKNEINNDFSKKAIKAAYSSFFDKILNR